MSRFGSFKINGIEYDLDDLTLDEVEAIEELSGGQAFAELNFGRARTMKAIAFTLIRRADPDLKIEDVGSVKVIDFMPADEELPDLPPVSEPATETPGDSALDGAGTLRSVGSTPG